MSASMLADQQSSNFVEYNPALPNSYEDFCHEREDRRRQKELERERREFRRGLRLQPYLSISAQEHAQTRHTRAHTHTHTAFSKSSPLVRV